MSLESETRDLLREGLLELPLPGSGGTVARHRLLAEFARRDVSLARLVEAHTDAIAILFEAGRQPVKNALYGVWASETPRQGIRVERRNSGIYISGTKAFCSGAGIVDRALVSIQTPDHLLADIDLRGNSESISLSSSGWIATAFAETNTAAAEFNNLPISGEDLIGPAGWYILRPGFWNGACGPAACWAGGAAGLMDYALAHPPKDPHGLAHLGAMHAAAWAMFSCLEKAGREIDAAPRDRDGAKIRALSLRHIVERLCADILERFGRAYGPRPLAFDAAISRRFQEVELYLRQCHAERDLESLSGQLTAVTKPPLNGTVANVQEASGRHLPWRVA